MRASVLALLLFVGIHGSARADGPWAHKLFAGDISHDFGVVPRGAQLKYTFKMTNIYKVPLEISDLRVSCGCVSAKESVKVLQPGESGAININMNGAQLTAPKSVNVYVTVSNPKYLDTATLTVQAKPRVDVVFNPGEIDFGLIHHGQGTAKFIDVEYAATFPWTITEIVKYNNDPFELAVEPLPNRAVKGFRIVAKVKPDAPAGIFDREVTLKTSDSGPAFSFHVLGNVQAMLSVQPETVRLDEVKVGEVKSQKIIVRGTRPFRITAIEGQGDGVTAPIPDRQATVHVLEVQFNPAMPGELKKQLTIRTDLDNEAVIVTVQGSGT